MTAFETVQDAWRRLSSEANQEAGIYERRIFAKTGRVIYAGLRRPNGSELLLCYFSDSLLANWTDVDTKGFLLAADRKVVVEGAVRVRLEIRHSSYQDLFARLCSDVVEVMLAAPDEAAALNGLRVKVDHWCRFLSIAGGDGLSEEAQRGLYGELLLFQRLIRAGCAQRVVLAAWQGPLASNHDFQFGNVAIEVKSTIANTDTEVQISNEYQLDNSGLHFLAVCVASLERRERHGETLPDLVRAISSSLDSSLVPSFADRLFAAGYHEAHETKYLGFGYRLRRMRYFKVTSEFPRIVPSDLRNGVRNVGYEIDVTGAKECEISQGQLTNLIF